MNIFQPDPANVRDSPVNVQDLEAVPRLTAACHVVKPAF